MWFDRTWSCSWGPPDRLPLQRPGHGDGRRFGWPTRLAAAQHVVV